MDGRDVLEGASPVTGMAYRGAARRPRATFVRQQVGSRVVWCVCTTGSKRLGTAQQLKSLRLCRTGRGRVETSTQNDVGAHRGSAGNLAAKQRCHPKLKLDWRHST